MALAAPAALPVAAPNSPCAFTLKNTGTAVPAAPASHPQDARPWLNSDIYRLTVSAQGNGWTAQLRNALAAMPFGESKSILVFVSHTAASASSGTITLTAASESDPTKKSSAVCRVKAIQAGAPAKNRPLSRMEK